MAIDIQNDGIIKFTEQGIETTNRDSILNYLLDQFKSIYGENAYIGLGTEDYNLISLFADVLNDMGVTAVQVANGYSLVTATGFQLDNIATVFYGNISRVQAKATTINVELSGDSGTVITNGKLVDSLGGFWNLPETVVIGAGGTAVVQATYSQTGAYSISEEQLSGSACIATPQVGWTNVEADGSTLAVGVPYESDTLFRARLALEQNKGATSTLQSLKANLYALIADGVNYVEKVAIWENDTNSNKTFSAVGLTVAPHSIAVSVYGSSVEQPIANHTADIAEAIYLYKGQGVGTVGTTTVAVDTYGDTDLEQSVQFGTTNVNFTIATAQSVPVAVTVIPLKTTAVTDTDIETAITEVLSQDISTIGIGGSIYAISLVTDVQNAINSAFESGTFQVTAITVNSASSVQLDYNEVATLGTVSVTIDS